MDRETAEKERRLERRWIREVMEAWGAMDEVFPEVAAFIAVTVAYAADELALAAAMARQMQKRTGAVCRTQDWLRWLQRTDDWESWLQHAARLNGLFGVKIALEAWLRSDRGIKLDPGCAEEMVDGWRSFDETPSEVARELLCGLLAGVDEWTVLKVVKGAAPGWRRGLDDGLNWRIWECSEWVHRISREEPLLAIKIGTEAALRHEVDNDLLVWGAELLEWWAVDGWFRVGEGKK